MSPPLESHHFSDVASTPPVGILSKQIVRSRAIKYIIPARIRSLHHNDILFVYENYIELYYHKNGYERPLHPSGTKDDFDCKIQAARGLTSLELREHLNIEPSLQRRLSRLPHQILVLKLDNKSLLFLNATASFTPSFETLSIPLPYRPDLASAASGPQDLLATGNDGLVVAVAGTEFGLILYNTWLEKGYLHKLVRHDVALTPPPNLIVLKMEFLQPAASDPMRASLVLLGLENRKTIIYIYSWDADKAFQKQDLSRPIRHALGKGKPITTRQHLRTIIVVYATAPRNFEVLLLEMNRALFGDGIEDMLDTTATLSPFLAHHTHANSRL
jgi:hypothetical protein